MRVLVTAGSTMVPFDSVRAITNIFKGRTGETIARYFKSVGHDVTLITSGKLSPSVLPFPLGCVRNFRTLDELMAIMKREIVSGDYDIVIHSAAPSDFEVNRVLSSNDDSLRDLAPVANNAKISSSHRHLIIDMTPTVKIIDLIRSRWGFGKKLVKFKLESRITDNELVKIAWASMNHSGADFIVANCLEWFMDRAYIIGADGLCKNVPRGMLAEELRRRLT